MIFITSFFKKNILKKVEKKNKIIRMLIFFISCFLVALCYNIFFVKNNLVIGGMGGLAIVFKETFGLNTNIFMIIATIILLLVSFLLLGKKTTKKNMLGAITYPILVTITEPIGNLINIQFNSYLFTVLIATISYNLLLGIIYKVGFNTGGGDIINQIIQKYAKTSIGQAGNYINILIIFTSVFVFGISKTIYAIFSVILGNAIVDFVVLGNRDSKFCIIKTKNVKYLEDFIKNDFNVGYSVLSSLGGTDRKKRRTIMCIVSSREYFAFKNLILDLDHEAFFVTHDCYEVLGGNNKRIINLN